VCHWPLSYVDDEDVADADIEIDVTNVAEYDAEALVDVEIED
jgi:hypothetical protein